MKKFNRFFKEWKWSLILLSLCIAGIPLCTIFGIQSVNWGNDFWPNALSEFLGMFVELIFGALFTFVVIDKYLQYHKNKQWQKIKNITYKGLYFSISDIVLKLNSSFPAGLREDSYSLSEDIETLNDYLLKEDLDVFIASLSQNVQKLIVEKFPDAGAKFDETISIHDETVYASLAKFKNSIKTDINNINSFIVPRLLNFSDDITLLDEIVELIEISNSLISKVHNIHKLNHKNSEVKLIWLVKIQDILTKLRKISDIIQADLNA